MIFIESKGISSGIMDKTCQGEAGLRADLVDCERGWTMTGQEMRDLFDEYNEECMNKESEEE